MQRELKIDVLEKSLPNVVVHTDGSCLKNPGGHGGIGVVVQKGIETIEISRGYPSTTNNRMEIQAIIEGLKSLVEPSSVIVYSDSTYAINCSRGLWRKRKNIDLWLELEPLLDKHRVRFEWVRGHADNELNNRCDGLAGEAARSFNSNLDSVS